VRATNNVVGLVCRRKKGECECLGVVRRCCRLNVGRSPGLSCVGTTGGGGGGAVIIGGSSRGFGGEGNPGGGGVVRLGGEARLVGGLLVRRATL